MGVYKNRYPRDGLLRVEVVCKAQEGHLPDGSIQLILTLDDWSRENYLLCPGAVYNGNRFKKVFHPYPPMLGPEDGIGTEMPPTITDVPALAVGSGPSRLQLKTGDMATPVLCVFSPAKKQASFLLFEQQAGGMERDLGLTLEESNDRATAWLTLSAPGVRWPHRYVICNNKMPPEEAGCALAAPNVYRFHFWCALQSCGSIPEFYQHFFRSQGTLHPPAPPPMKTPYSVAWSEIEEKYNREHWVEQEGFYRSSSSPHPIFGYWQTGWVGGGMATLALLALGSGDTPRRARATLDFLFAKLQAPSGFLYGIYAYGQLYGDGFTQQKKQNILLLRKNADVLYFLLKHFLLLDARGRTRSPALAAGNKAAV